MMHRVIKRMQRGPSSQQQQRQPPPPSPSASQQPPPSPSPPRQQRPTLTRGHKSYSDSTMETTATSMSDQNSIPSNSTRRNHSAAPSRSNSGNSSETSRHHHRHRHSNSPHGGGGGDETSEDDWTQSDSTHPADSTMTSKRTSVVVSFAGDYGSPPERIASHLTRSDDELLECFYTTSELNSLDRDRALTVLMYQTRNKSIPWDDNEHSLRGLEEYTSAAATTTTTTTSSNHHTSSDGYSDATTTSRRTTRKELIQAVLQEQTRLRDTARGREEVVQASKVSGLSPEELLRELLRGVSCSLSKCDRQRAIQLAQKDEKEVSVYNTKWRDQLMSTTQYCNNITSMMMNQFTPTSRRRYLGMVKNKINDWSNSSNRSISSTGTCGDRSTTSSNGGHHHHHHHPNVHTRKAIARNNSADDSVTSENNGNAEDIIDEVTDNFNTNAVVRTPTPQPKPFPVYNNDVASPLSIIRQVVYETSKEFDYDHSSRHSPSNHSMDSDSHPHRHITTTTTDTP